MDEKTFNLINKIAEEHSHKTFGYLSREDLKNEIWLIALERLKDYSPERGKLENYLRVAVSSRIVNTFKVITKTVRSPCGKCPFYRPQNEHDCAGFLDKDNCDKWQNYQSNVNSRNALLNATESSGDRQYSSDALNSIILDEAKEFLLKNIDVSFKRDFNLLLNGEKINNSKLRRLKQEISRTIRAAEEESPMVENLTSLTINGVAKEEL